VSYAIVCTEYADAAQGELVKAYVGYMASEKGQAEAAKSAGAAPLSSDLQKKVATVLASVK
jgi:phosphate transport system substrate-binding protein